MTDLATIGYAVDTSGLERGAQALDQFAAKNKAVYEPLGAIEAAARRAGVSVEEMRQRIANAGAANTTYGQGLKQTTTATNAATTATQRHAAAVKQDSEAVNQAGNPFKAAAGAMDNMGGASRRSVVNLAELRSALRVMGREAQLIGGPMGDLIRTMSTLTQGAARLPLPILLITLAIAALSAGLLLAIRQWAALEAQQAKTTAALNLTRNASGQTAEGLTEMARRLAASGTQTIDDVRAAQVELLKYKEVSGEVFEFILAKAKDVAAGGFVDLKGAVKGLAEAFKDPTQAFEKFAEMGLKISVSEQRLITTLFQSGKLLESRQKLLELIAKQGFGNDATAADTLTGAWHRLTRSSGELLEKWGEQIDKAVGLKDKLDALAQAAERLKKLNDSQPQPDLVEKLPLPLRVLAAPFKYGARAARALSGVDQPSVSTAPTGTPFGARFADSATQIMVSGQAMKKLTEDITQQAKERDELNRRLDITVEKLRVEGIGAGLNATQQKILQAQIEAGAVSFDRFGNAILGTGERANKVAQAVVRPEILRFSAQLTAAGIQQRASLEAEAGSVNMAVGAATEYKKQLEDQARAKAAGIPLSDALRAKIDAEAKALGIAAQAAEKAKVDASIKRDRDTMFLSPEDLQIAEKLKGLYGNDIPAAMASSEAAAMRFNNTLKFGFDLMKDFALDLAKAALAGGNMMDALVSGLDKVASKLLDKAFQDALTGLASMDPMMLAKAGVEAAIAVGISIFTGKSKAAKAEEERLKAAQKAWFDMTNEVTKFKEVLNGGSGGGLTGALRETSSKVADFVIAANKAGDFKAMNDIIEANYAHVKRVTTDFARSFSAVVKAMEEGTGFDSPFVKGQQQIQDLTGKIKDFVTDTQTVFSNAAYKVIGGTYGFPSTGDTDASSQMATAQAAGRALLLAQLSGVTVLSDVAMKLVEMEGKALGVAQALTDLGLSAEQAAVAVEAARKKGIAKIAEEFVDGIQRAINDGLDKGYLNEMKDLVADVAKKRADAVLLGADPALIDRYFSVTAQKIVNSAGLAGDAFSELLVMFPNLTGVVTESTEALKAQIEEQKRFYDELQKDIAAFIAGLKFGGLSTLSPAAQFAASQADFNSTAASNATKAAQTYLENARSFLGPSEAYGAVYREVTSKLGTLMAMAQGGGTAAASVTGDVMSLPHPPIIDGGSMTSSGAPVSPSAPGSGGDTMVDEIRALRSDFSGLRGDLRSLLNALIRAAEGGNETAISILHEIAGLRTDTRQVSGEQLLRAASGRGF